MKKEFIENMTNEDIIDAALASVDDVSDLVEKLVDIRKANGLTQKDVAKFMGVKQSAVARFENMTVIPKANTLFLYASAVGEKIELKSKIQHKQNIAIYIYKSSDKFFAKDDSFELNQFRAKNTNVSKANFVYKAA